MFDVTNGVTLCLDCHEKTETYPKQFVRKKNDVSYKIQTFNNKMHLSEVDTKVTTNSDNTTQKKLDLSSASQ